MTGKRRKTVLRTIRLSEDIDTILEEEARAQNISINALIGKIMTRYIEWERVVEKFDYVSFSNVFFKALISEVNDERLRAMASQEAIRQVKNQAMWIFGKTDFDALLKIIILIGRYGIAAHTSSDFRDDGACIITVHHQWGNKGTVFLQSFFDSLVRDELRVQPAISVSNDVITVSFQKSQKRIT